MEDKLIEKMNNLTMALVTAIVLFGVINTIFLSHRITELENKIEAIKTFKSK